MAVEDYFSNIKESIGVILDKVYKHLITMLYRILRKTPKNNLHFSVQLEFRFVVHKAIFISGEIMIARDHSVFHYMACIEIKVILKVIYLQATCMIYSW